MLAKLIKINSRRDRKDNNLYFSSMIISIIAFYIILALPQQDVMIFLQKIESSAVERLFSIVPVFYILTLVILFFLIYFVSDIQIERRKHELAIYLALGMKRSKMLTMLFLENLKNNVYKLGLGIPIAILLSELISLITSKMVGLGIVNHQISFSLNAVFFTVIGFFTINLLALIIISCKLVGKDIGELLFYTSVKVKKQLPSIIYFCMTVLGLLLLGIAYYLGISGKSWTSLDLMGITVLLGFIGTILFFFGLRLFIALFLKLKLNKNLHTYNFRQIQEFVIRRSTLIAMCSLLLFFALFFLGTGVAISFDRASEPIHVLDYTFKDTGLPNREKLDINKVREVLKQANLEKDFSQFIEIKLAYPQKKQSVSFADIERKLKSLPVNESQKALLHIFGQYNDCYLISASSYNKLKEAAQQSPLTLKKGEVALYMSKYFLIDENMVNKVLQVGVKVKLVDEQFTISQKAEHLPLVTDNSITISVGLIVPDDIFYQYTNEDYLNYVSGILSPELVAEKGLISAIFDMNSNLEQKTTLEFESYIQNMGRRIFFVIAGSYLTIYLAIIFLVIANSIIGIQFLVAQRKSYKRYQTLVHLGASYETICQSSNKQINWYFGLPLTVALLNSFFGIASIFTGFLQTASTNHLYQKYLIAIIVVFLLIFMEYIYITVVKKNSNKYLLTIMQPKREE